MSTVPPIRREILVDAAPDTAFEVFTARIAQWWPLAELSVHGAGTTVAFEDGQIVEPAPDGATSLWGTVTRWEPPGALAFSWHPGRPADRASHVEISFAAAADDAGLPADPEFRAALRAYMEWAAGHFTGYPDRDAAVPSGLPMPRWGWDGLELG